MGSMAASPLPNRWLLKDVDTFAGFAHAIHTYLGGVSLADAHGLSLLHQPFQSAHGMGFNFDDFLMGDERGLVAPLAAPMLSVDSQAQLLVGGRSIKIGTVSRAGSTAQVTSRLRDAPADSLTHVRKGRFAFADPNPSLCVNCTITPEARYAALWLRERFWRAARARERRVAAASGSGSSGSGGSSSTITIAAHVRRGDVTWLDKYGRPSSRWVDTEAMLEVLRGVGSVLGMSLAPPAVAVHLFSEAKGWQANDTAALRALVPHAKLHLDSGPAATIDALITMSRADVLLMGSSGFSNWAAIFGCGVKIGPAHKPMMPMRHVPYSNTLVAQSGPFAAAAQAAFARIWAEYDGCKRDASCLPTLCAPRHIADPRWTDSSLAKAYAAMPRAAQWHVPAVPPLTTTLDERPGGGGAAASPPDGRSTLIDGWKVVRDECERSYAQGTEKVVTCTRSKWSRKVSAALSLKQRLVAAATANTSSSSSGGGGGRGVGGGGGSAGGGAAVGGESGAGGKAPLLPVKTTIKDGLSYVVWA